MSTKCMYEIAQSLPVQTQKRNEATIYFVDGNEIFFGFSFQGGIGADYSTEFNYVAKALTEYMPHILAAAATKYSAHLEAEAKRKEAAKEAAKEVGKA